MTTANIHPCTCPVCSIPDSEPFDVEPIDFLQCEWTFRHFSPHAFFGNETNEAWWKTFEPHAKPWILSAIAAGEIEGPIEAWHGAKTLISSGYDDCDGQREWLEMNGFQLLFETLGHGGLLEGWSITNVVAGMRSFMAYLTTHGIVDAASGAHIGSELETWQPRIIAYFDDDGPWYRDPRASELEQRRG
tara:strand:+ start:7612 stop:8178 length:567 start_codon:yes stop_codon:yes gene_type:complete